VERAGIAADCLPGCRSNQVFTEARGDGYHRTRRTKGEDRPRGDVLLVETLDPEYYENVHLPGAVNLPLDRIGELAPDILPDKGAEIIVYCMSSL